MSLSTLPRGDLAERAQVVIVGAGAGGSIAALTLAEAGLDVVVVEDGYAFSGAPQGIAETAARYFAEGAYRATSGTGAFPVAGGRGIGGSTLVNSALCFRTPAERVDEWNELAGDVFADTAAYFQTQDAVEAVLGVAPTPEHLLSGNDRAQREAARNLGWSEGPLRRNAPGCVGCGRCNQGCPSGGKNSVDRAFLPRAVAAGARIYAGCCADGLASGRVEGRITGPEGEALGRFRVDADLVVLCGGAIQTPRLLLDTGAVPEGGPVGDGLRVQPVISTLAFFPKRSIYAPGATQGHFIDEFKADDILFESNPMIGNFLAAQSMYGAELHRLLSQGFRWASTGMLIRDRSRGRVGPSDGSRARIDYATNEEDRSRFVRALRVGAQLWFEGLGAERISYSLFGHPMARTMAEVDAALADVPTERLILYASHPQASCSLGRALDLEGQVLGLPGVYVMDASVLPSNVGRNPQISVMTVARVLAERLATARGGRLVPLA